MPLSPVSPKRSRLTALFLVVSLLVLATGVWALPPLARWGPGPTPLEVELSTERARNADLKRQVDAFSARRPHPVVSDGTQAARADDLKARLDAAKTDARADDLKRQLAKVGLAGEARGNDLARQLRIAYSRSPAVDGVQRARADDLATQNDELEALLTRPRPSVELSVSATLTKDQLLASRNLFGLYTAQSPFSYAEVDLVQADVGRQADIVGYFQSFLDPFRPDAIKDTWRRGQVPLLTWESQPQVGAVTPDMSDYSIPVILSGRYDELIRSYADGIRDLGLPVILRFDHEMNGTWYPWSEVRGWDGSSVNGNRRGDYAAMWRHVHDIFEAEGANAYTVWLWSPNRVNRIPSQPSPAEFYPGDDVVDWVGMSGYNRPGDEAPSFEDTYGSTLPLLRQSTSTKPIFLSEIGATEDGGHKPAWIVSLFQGLQANLDIIGFAWFSLTVSGRFEGKMETNDWRLNSTSQASGAMKDQLAQWGYGRPI